MRVSDHTRLPLLIECGGGGGSDNGRVLPPEAWEYLFRAANRSLVHLVTSTTSMDI